LEIGVGDNQLRWKFAGGTANRLAFSLKPTARLLYSLSLSDKIHLFPFIGYDEFGGKSEETPDGYKDELWFRALEFGVMGVYQTKRIELGGGFKTNHHLKVVGRYYGSLVQPPDEERSWREVTWTDDFPKTSYSVGIRAGGIYHSFRLAGEAWFGLTDIVGDSIFGDLGATGHENHYRLMFGYQF
jgi:hypothetical protein